MPTTTINKEKRKVRENVALPNHSNQKWWRKAIELLLATALTIIALEGLFFVCNLGEQEWVELDEVHGYLPIANKQVTYRKEGLSHLKFNSYAMNDIEHSKVKAVGSKRIAVIGDSYVMSIEVDRKNNFCSQLQEILNEKGGSRNYEVLNFGVAGYGLNQVYTLLKEKVLDFDPDIVVFPYTVEATCSVAPTITGPLPKGPYYFLNQDGSLIEDHTVQDVWKNSQAGKRMNSTSWLREHSRIWGVFSTAVEQVYAWNKDSSILKNFLHNEEAKAESAKPVAHAQSTSRKLTSKVTEDSIAYLWPTAKAILSEMNRLCQQNSCKFVLLRLPIKNGKFSPSESQYLKEFADSKRIIYFDYTDIFKDNVMSHPRPFYQVHLSPYGHKQVAEQLFRSLESVSLIKPSVKKR